MSAALLLRAAMAIPKAVQWRERVRKRGKDIEVALVTQESSFSFSVKHCEVKQQNGCAHVWSIHNCSWTDTSTRNTDEMDICGHDNAQRSSKLTNNSGVTIHVALWLDSRRTCSDTCKVERTYGGAKEQRKGIHFEFSLF